MVGNIEVVVDSTFFPLTVTTTSVTTAAVSTTVCVETMKDEELSSSLLPKLMSARAS